jgi:hypothetical protein
MKPLLLSLFCSLFCFPAAACHSTPANVESHGAKDVKYKAGKYAEIRFEDGQEAYEIEGLRLLIPRIKNDLAKRKVVVTFELRNDLDTEVRFALNDVRMSYEGHEYAAKGADLLRMDPNPNVLAKTTKKGAWAFELDSVAKPGEYEAHIKNIMIMRAGSAFSLGKDLDFKVKVPGEPGTM